MKVAIFLLACVAVSQAAFTGSLVQQTRPAVAQAMFQVRLAASRGRSDSGMQTQIVAALENQVSEILANIDSAVTAGQQIATSVVQQLSDAYAQLQALGSNIMANGQEILGNLFGGLFNGLFGRSDNKFISNIIDFVSNFSVTDALNGLASIATNLVNSIDLGDILSLIASQVIPKPIADLILGQLGLRAQRNFFSNLWGSISNGASSVWSEVVDIAGNIADVASGAFANLQQIAAAFANDAFSQATAITSEAAAQFLDFLRPYQQDMGALYDQVAAQLGQMVGN